MDSHVLGFCHSSTSTSASLLVYVGRAASSEWFVQDIRRKDRRTPMKVLVAKTFRFVDCIWLIDSGYGKH